VARLVNPAQAKSLETHDLSLRANEEIISFAEFRRTL